MDDGFIPDIDLRADCVLEAKEAPRKCYLDLVQNTKIVEF
jgi:hypothetical protein